MKTKPLDEQLYEHLARKKRAKQEQIDRWVTYLDHTVTVLQLVVGTIIAVYVTSWVTESREVSREISTID